MVELYLDGHLLAICGTFLRRADSNTQMTLLSTAGVRAPGVCSAIIALWSVGCVGQDELFGQNRAIVVNRVRAEAS